jgi:hypothetical protein
MAGHEHEGQHRDYEKRVPSTEMERLAVAAAKLACTDALNELFAQMGINRADFEAMESFREDVKFIRSLRKRKELWSDLSFLNSLRSGSVKAGTRFAMALITIIAGGFAYGMYSWFQAWIRTVSALPPHP